MVKWDEKRHADLMAASRHLGESDASKLAWVVRFANEDASLWHSAERATRGDCLLVLAGPGRVAPNQISPLPKPLDEDSVATIHAELKHLLRDVVQGPANTTVSFKSGGHDVAITRATDEGVKPAIWGWSYTGNVQAVVLRVVADLILRAGDRLVACKFKGCRNPIVAHRKQEYCDATCSQLARTAKKAQRRKGGHHGKATRKR